MNSQELRNLQEAYIDVYEDWKSPNVDRLKSRMGGLERQIPSNRGADSPEYARYQRTADVVSQSTRNPNKPFQKPTFDPGGLRVKPGGGVTSSQERNSQWQPFSSRLPNQPKPTQSKPSTSATQSKPSTSSSSSTQTRGAFANRLTTNRSGNGQFMDRSGDYGAALRTRGSSSKGGGSSAQDVTDDPNSKPIAARSRNYQIGGGARYGIAGVGLADSYDLYDIILSHLLDEGYAETQEQAEVIMVNMSEDWRESIFEAEVLAAKGGVPGTMKVKPTQQGGFLGIGARTVNKPVPGSFTPKDVSSTDAARYNNQVDKNFTRGGDNTDSASARTIQRRAKDSGHSGYMNVKNPGSIPDTGIPNRPSPGRASDQNQARKPGWS